jgi:hypothetical protein
MVIATIPNRESKSQRVTEFPATAQVDWVKIAACGSLLTGGLLLLSGQKRAGLVMAASGTALALLDHEETLREWWDAMPGYVDSAQSMLEQVQDVVENITEKGESLRRVLSRRSPSMAG